jgi:hypothetical protein
VDVKLACCRIALAACRVVVQFEQQGKSMTDFYKQIVIPSFRQ